MFDFIKDAFNCNAYPRRITSLPETRRGEAIQAETGAFLRWSSLDYEMQFYASRNDDRSYDIKCFFHSTGQDARSTLLQKSVPLDKAITIIRGYDDRATKAQMEQNKYVDFSLRREKIDKLRKRHNVRRVQSRLTQSNPMRH